MIHPRAARPLELALLATIVCHATAMLSMAALLLPLMPGSGGPDIQRVALLAAHPWQFRLGWFPWQVTAVSDVALGLALVLTPWVPRRASVIALLFTGLAVILDQTAQIAWMTRGLELAQEAQRTGDLEPYLAFERFYFPLTGCWAALLYTAGAIGWSVALAQAGTWSRLLTRLSIGVWTLFILISIGPLLPKASALPASILAVGNALGFVLMMAWFGLALECVLRRARPETTHGHWAPWRAPTHSLLDRLLEVMANSRALHAFGEWLPFFEFRSDITEVIYVNYLVPAETLARWIPEGLELQRLGPQKRLAMFTFLTYRHGHFGPAIIGPLRKMFGSPVQSNWRVYVRNPRTGTEGVYFTTTAIDARLQSLGARLMAEGVPMHLLHSARLRRSTEGHLTGELDPGAGSAPDARLDLKPSARELPSAWAACFADYEAMLRYIVPQDRAMTVRAGTEEVVRQEIDLGIALTACEPLAGTVSSRAAEAMVGQATPLCFRVPQVMFRFTHQQRDAIASRLGGNLPA